MKKPRASRRGHLVRGGGVLSLVAGLCLMPALHASADTPFDAVASAYGFDAILSNASIPAGISPEGAGPVAQSELTSLPSGTSFASFPYPGDVVAGVPGLASGIVIGLPQLPPYPFVVTAGLGEDTKEINQPGIGLSATTEASHARAHAVVGTEGSGAVADTRITTDGFGGVSSTATSRFSGLSLGDLGEIGSVVSTASAALGSDGKVVKSSHLKITGISVPALELTIPSQTPAPAPIPGLPIPTVPLPFAGTTLKAPVLGFVDGQFTVQLPLLGNQQFAIPAQTVLDALRASGLDVKYSAARTNATGVVGATLTFHYVIPPPPKNSTYSGPTDVKLALGRTSASVASDAASAPVPLTPGLPGTPTTVDPVITDPGSGIAADPGTPVVGPVEPAVGGVVPDPVIDPVPQTSSGNQLAVSNVLGRRKPLSDNLYLVLVAAGLIGTFSSQTLRLLGVRHR